MKAEIRAYRKLLRRPEWREKDLVISRAEKAWQEPFRFITDTKAAASPGGKHYFFSNADYLWPNPEPDGVHDYISRDGETNPANFEAHRDALRHMRRTVVYLAAGYRLTGDERYAARAAEYLRRFFLDEETYMCPDLSYAQYITGEGFRKGTGIIDTLHLIDVPVALGHMEESPHVTAELQAALVKWFEAYLGWMLSSRDGIEEMITTNNHAITFFLQAAVWARFTDNPYILEFCRDMYVRHCLPQLAANGSFPLETARTKPLGYSVFTLDNLVNLAWFISDEEHDYLTYKDEEGRGVEAALAFLEPYLFDLSAWPYPRDVMHHEGWPARLPFMLIAAYTLGRDQLEALYWSLPPYSPDKEVRRNSASREPLLWLEMAWPAGGRR